MVTYPGGRDWEVGDIFYSQKHPGITYEILRIDFSDIYPFFVGNNNSWRDDGDMIYLPPIRDIIPGVKHINQIEADLNKIR